MSMIKNDGVGVHEVFALLAEKGRPMPIEEVAETLKISSTRAQHYLMILSHQNYVDKKNELCTVKRMKVVYYVKNKKNR